MLKATNVDGVYDADPRHNPNARLLETVSYHEVSTRDLSVMDMTAITLCQENNIPSTHAISLTFVLIFYFINFLIYRVISQLLCLTCKRLGTLQRLLSVRRLVPSSDAQEIRNKMETRWLKKEDWLMRCELQSCKSWGSPSFLVYQFIYMHRRF